MNSRRNSDNNIGYIGNTSYNLKYITRSRNFRCTWPHNNLFATAKDEDSLLQNLLIQKVGRRNQINDDEKLKNLKYILKCFLQHHRKTNYKLVLEKCAVKKNLNESSKTNLRPLSRQVMKEFLHRIIFNVIPLNLFGSKKNQLQFERNLRHILYFGKSQVFNLKMVMNKITVKNIKYLEPFLKNIEKTNLITKVYIWLIRTYISAALKCVFYVTESNYSSKFVFYEKHIWQKIQQHCLNNIKKKVIRNYKNFPVNSCTISTKNINILKILPKFRGSRPVFIRWRNDDYSKLKTSHEVQIMKQTLSKIASVYFKISQTSPEEFHNRWLQLYYTWLSLGRPSVKFVRIDFVDAFGSINQEKLMQILLRLKEQRKILEIEYTFRNTLKKINIIEAFRILENYVTNFIFKNNKIIYKLIRGIHQGGSLSSALCNLYFAEINAQYLFEYMNDPLGFFVQNCDDYLYITMVPENAVKFLNRMEEGFPDFNMTINRTKTYTNIHDDSNYITNFGRYEMNVNSFQLFACYKSYQNISTFHRSVLRSLATPGVILSRRLMLFSSMNLNKIYFDCTYNTPETIIHNVFLVAYLAAIRCVSLIKALFTNCNTNYIFICIHKCIFHIARTAMKRIEKYRDVINVTVLQWIAFKAFHLKLKNSGSQFNTLSYKVKCYSITLSNTFHNKPESSIFEKFENIQRPVVLRNLS